MTFPRFYGKCAGASVTIIRRVFSCIIQPVAESDSQLLVSVEGAQIISANQQAETFFFVFIFMNMTHQHISMNSVLVEHQVDLPRKCSAK